MQGNSPKNKSIQSAPASKSAERPTCGTCGYHDHAGQSCNRSPAPILGKVADDWCGDHPDFPDYLKAK